MNQVLLQYPEFLLAVVLGALCVMVPQRDRPDTDVSYLGAVATSVCEKFPRVYLDWLNLHQVQAGLRNRAAVSQFACWKIYPVMLTPFLALVMPIYFVPLVAMFVLAVPDLWLYFAVRKRRRIIAESLPQALDLILLCVDAGLGLEAALQRIANEKTILASALNEELSRLGRDILLGMDRERAYADLYARTGVDEMRSLGSALNQSQKLGLSIANILRTQSDFIRQRQQRLAEEKAAKLPVWMAFPLWFCIMPALMLILVAPSILLFIHQSHPLPPGLWK